MSRFKPSNYNRAVAYHDKMLLFNGVSSALVMVDVETYEALRPYLFTGESFDLESAATDELKGRLRAFYDANYLLDEHVDELDYLRQRYHKHQENDPVSITVATTMDCNLGCYYCFEDKYESYANTELCDRVYDYAIHDLTSRKKNKLYMTWYGGEPMLNPGAINYLSDRLIRYCDDHGARYIASMVSNGTMWPSDAAGAAEFVTRNRIQHIQFSFDGLPQNHNKRRRYKDGNSKHEESSFDRLCHTVDAIVGRAKLYLRLNLDKGNREDAFPLVDFFYERGWLAPGSKVYPYLAHLGPLTSVCGFMENTAINLTEFDLFNNEFRRYLGKYVDLREFTQLQHYPKSIQLNCVAVAGHSVIFGPDGAMYKCANEVGMHDKSFGRIDGGSSLETSHLFPILTPKGKPANTAHNYLAYDPFSHPSCSKCEYLPVCMGGCPKAQFEHNDYYIDAFYKFWENSFEPMIRGFADAMLNGNNAESKAAVETPLSQNAMEWRREISGFDLHR